MACVISAISSNSGKTLLSLLLISWLKSIKKTVQTFKVGPDYLDPQQLSLISKRPCRNLDLILSGKDWVKNSFEGYGASAELSLIEGVMGLFDGIGASERGSTADIALLLKLPVVMILDARGQAASIAPLIKGFRDQSSNLEIAGVVLNHVNSQRHKALLTEVLENNKIQVLGSIPNSDELFLPSKYLGLAPAHEIQNLKSKIKIWSSIAKKCLDIDYFSKLLEAPKSGINPIKKIIYMKEIKKKEKINYPIAIAKDNAFHFRYSETKEILEELGMPLIDWEIVNDQPIPKEARGIIIPGGFPEQYAEEISNSKRSLNDINKLFGKIPIYAECGGMLILGKSLYDTKGNKHSMAGILPFEAKEGKLEVGYREIKGIKDSLIMKKDQTLIGHEYHKWQINLINQQTRINSSSYPEMNSISSPWMLKGWGLTKKREGWSNDFLHASWIHLHWPTAEKVISLWTNSIKDF